MTLDAQKAGVRKSAFVTRKRAYDAGQGRAADLLAAFLAPFHGKTLAGYMPMRTEIDPLPAMAAHQGPVCVPVIIGKGLALKFRQWTPGCPMIVGDFGAQIPQNGPWLEPDILIVPLLAFDARGYRLGYGGGFYDRTLQGLRAKRAILAVGYAFASQQVSEVPIDENDQRLDTVITELGAVTL